MMDDYNSEHHRVVPLTYDNIDIQPALRVGARAPDFELVNVDGAESPRGDGVVEEGQPLEALSVREQRVGRRHQQHAELRGRHAEAARERHRQERARQRRRQLVGRGVAAAVGERRPEVEVPQRTLAARDEVEGEPDARARTYRDTGALSHALTMRIAPNIGCAVRCRITARLFVA